MTREPARPVQPTPRTAALRRRRRGGHSSSHRRAGVDRARRRGPRLPPLRARRRLVSVPAGAKAGDLILEPCHYATESGSYAADCGTLVVPENRANPKLAPDRAAGHAHPGPLGAPRGAAIFRLEGGPGVTNMKFPEASRFADDHDVVLVGYRGVDGSVAARLPGGRVGAQALDRLPRREVVPRVRRRASVPARTGSQDDGVDLAGYTLAAAGRRSRGRARGARLRPHRPPQRERRDAHGADLRLALPEEHPPLGDDRRRTRPATSSGTRRRPTSRSAATPTLCAKDDELPHRGPTTSPRRCGGPPPTSPTAGCSCRSRRATCGSPPSSG